MDAVGRSCSTAASPCPAARGAGVGGPGAPCRGLIFRAIHPFWRAGSCGAFACVTPQASSLPRLLCPSCIPPSGGKRQPCHGSSRRYFCSSAFVHLFCSSGLAVPTLVQPSTHHVGRRGNKTRALLHLGSSMGEQRGLCFKMGCPGYRGLLPKSISVPCIPGLCPGEPRSSPQQLPQQRAGDAAVPPFPVPRLPKSLETHQLLSKPCNMGPLGEGRSRGKPCTLLPAVVNLPGEGRGGRGTW